MMYSNNTNAGTATITITGKGDYTGTASGTFTITKASRTLSFADSYMVLNTSSTGTKTATPSVGSGDGAITYSIANTTYATINSSTGAVTAKTSDGSVIVTASIAEGQNYLSASASYTLYVFATTHNYSYSGSAKNVTLPPGTYKLECWGAQGGYCTDGYYGGKGGYSVGQLSIANALAIQVLVGGQNGYNGGGSSTGSSSYNSGGTNGRSTMGNGGGATDIRLSTGTLLSRMIVAGGGSGGAYCYKEYSESVTVPGEVVENRYLQSSDGVPLTFDWGGNWYTYPLDAADPWNDLFIYVGDYIGYTFESNYSATNPICLNCYPTPGQSYSSTVLTYGKKFVIPSGAQYITFHCAAHYGYSNVWFKITSPDTTST